MNALTDPELGRFVEQYFVSSFQKVATFTIVGGTKQGGNVAAYFCAPDGRVLHTVAGPVDAATMLREARWVVESVQKAMAENEKTGTPFKVLFRQWHAERLRTEHGITVSPVVWDTPAGEDDPLSYNDPTGRPIVPVLPPPPIDGPDVTFRLAQEAESKAAGARGFRDRRGGEVVLGTQAQTHRLLSAHALVKIEKVYATVFQDILGERVSTRPVVTIDSPAVRRGVVCLHCESRRER